MIWGMIMEEWSTPGKAHGAEPAEPGARSWSVRWFKTVDVPC
jgi:hypothetical protein